MNIKPPNQKTWLGEILDWIIPESDKGSGLAAILVTIGLTILGTLYGATLLKSYGWGVFVAMPFCLGMVSVFIYGYRQPRTYRQALRICVYSIILAGIALLCVAVEGLICLIMAAPLGLILAVLGGTVAYVLLRMTRWRKERDRLICTAVLAIPFFISAEHYEAPKASLLRVQSAVEVKAVPEIVWRHVVSFSELPPPRDWFFHTGVAYPIRAVIRGRGVGAVRRCEFSTGPFIEPIEVWDEPRLLKFSVTENPAPLQEWSPYRHLHPPHLNGFLVSQGGQFLLTENADGTTHLEGTTWYRHHMWPAGYWQLWSDFIIHRIHLRVLEHVKNLAEKDTTN